MAKQFKFLQSERLPDWVKKLGLIGFLFFLIKGLLWLIVPALLIYFGIEYKW